MTEHGILDIVLTDFDVALFMDNYQYRYSYYRGTDGFVAPEIMSNPSPEYNYVADIWSAGVCFLVLV